MGAAGAAAGGSCLIVAIESEVSCAHVESMLVLELAGSEAESMVEGYDEDADEQELNERRKRRMVRISNSFILVCILPLLL